MSPKRIVALLCLFTALLIPGRLTPPAQAQETASQLTLESALKRVYRDNPALWRLRQERVLWQARITQAGLGPNPELSLVNEDAVGSAAFTQDRFTQFTLGLAQTLVLGNKIEYRTRLAQIQQQLADWDYRLQLQNLGAEVYRSYVRLLNLEAQRLLVNELGENARAQHELLSKSVQAGRLAPAVLLQSASVVKSFEAEALELSLEAQAHRQDLAALWGASESDFTQLAGPLPLTGWGPYQSLEQGLQNHPKLARWQIESQQRQLALDAAQAQTVPDLNLSGGLRYHPSLDWGLVLSLGIPLALFDRNQGNIEEAQLRKASWNKEREFEASGLRTQLRKAYDQAQGQLQLIEILKAQVSLSESQRETALKSFESGKTGSLELLMASQNRDQLRRRLIAAQGQRLLAVVEVLALTQVLLPERATEQVEVRDDLRH